MSPVRVLIVALTAATIVAASPVPRAAPEAQAPTFDDAFTLIEAPTGDGDWYGTWVYIYRDGRMALWVRRGEDGRPEARVRFQSTISPEEFETGWDGRATYILADEPATFHFDLERRDDNRLDGRWLWDVQFKTSGRSERGEFTMYRTYDGRMAVLQFRDYEKVVRKGEKLLRYDGHASWGYRKVSKRLVLWDELF